MQEATTLDIATTSTPSSSIANFTSGYETPVDYNVSGSNYEIYPTPVSQQQDQHYQYYPDYSSGCYYDTQQSQEYENGGDTIGNDYYSHYYNSNQEFYWNNSSGQQDEDG